VIPFTIVTGTAAPLPSANLDTDVIMPKQFLKRIDRAGLAQGVFHDLRIDPAGQVRRDFILNHPPYDNASILVTGPNFGCGSSREHAVWGLMQRGVRAIIGSSFGGIFYGNCEKNGLLVITLDEGTIDHIVDLVSTAARSDVTIDLPQHKIRLANGENITFDINPRHQQALIEGLDHISETLKSAEMIRKFEQSHLEAAPWLAAGP